MSRASSSTSRRDPRFDLWRGLALVDMAWVHLASYPIGMPDAAALWIGEYTRFAAGFFVMLAGLTVRLAFGVGLASQNPTLHRATVRRLLRRAALLLFVDRLAGVVFALIESLLRTGTAGPSFDPDRLIAVATFQQPGATGGLLVLYTMLLALTAPLERLRTAAGGPSVVALSLSVFALAQWIGVAAHWPPWTFPVAHWQPLFVAGYLATPHLARLKGAGGMRWLALSAAALAGVFVLRSGHALGLADGFGPWILFRKVPLNTAELAWYALSSAFVLVASTALFERSSWVREHTGWLQRLGRWSLVIYVAHLLVELPIIAIASWLDPSPALRATSLVVIVVLLDAIARAADFVTARRASAASPLRMQDVARRLVPVGGVVGSAVATMCALVVLATPAPEWVRRHQAAEPEIVLDAATDAEDASFVEAETHLVDEDVSLLDAELGTFDLGAGDATEQAPVADDEAMPQLDDAEFTTPPAIDDGFDGVPSSTVPFGERPLEPLIDDEIEPIAN